jgi:hypothetical protein
MLERAAQPSDAGHQFARAFQQKMLDRLRYSARVAQSRVMAPHGKQVSVQRTFPGSKDPFSVSTLCFILF